MFTTENPRVYDGRLDLIANTSIYSLLHKSYPAHSSLQRPAMYYLQIDRFYISTDIKTQLLMD